MRLRFDIRGKEKRIYERLGVKDFELLKATEDVKSGPVQALLSELRAIQCKLSEKVNLQDIGYIRDLRYIIGYDLTFKKTSSGTEIAIAGAVIYEITGYDLSRPFSMRLRKLTEAICLSEVIFPYIPTYLAYRELPALLGLWWNIRTIVSDGPSAHFIDGQGIAHPRKLGIATHFGILTSQLSIGCAKRKLWGQIEEEPPPGGWSPITDKGKIIGYLYRPYKGKRRMLYISPGNYISPLTALKITMRTVEALGHPPTHSAHLFLRSYRCEWEC